MLDEMLKQVRRDVICNDSLFQNTPRVVSIFYYGDTPKVPSRDNLVGMDSSLEE